MLSPVAPARLRLVLGWVASAKSTTKLYSRESAIDILEINIMSTDNQPLLVMTTQLAKSYVAGNKISSEDLPGLINDLHQTLLNLNNPETATTLEPSVSIRKSVKNDQIICLDCGKGHKILKRHLRTAHGLTINEYRERWNLPADYPVVAADYSVQRSKMAVKIGLGRKPGGK
ncbi:MAG: putative transcriptional regulator [Alphaproteobacteria bacterium]|jgi:predicted transcriptional regulator